MNSSRVLPGTQMRVCCRRQYSNPDLDPAVAVRHKQFRSERRVGEIDQPPLVTSSDLYLIGIALVTRIDLHPRGRCPRAKAPVFGPIGMEQLWNRGGATGGKGSGDQKPEMALNERKALPPAATCCRLDRMVNRASAVGCHR
jgi:hypothetical protein